ncbi:MAG: ArnT family glycosyltransferase, partial [Phycisphaerales bacterium]
MQEAGDWLVPTVNHEPYLAKPPMFYWVQLAIAELRSAETGELELRLTAALAGLAGVLATYWLVRKLMAAEAGSLGRPSIAREAALWSALFLATGPLYVRSSRIGELDILLAPFVVVSIGAVVSAWLTWRERGRVSFGMLALATLSAVGAALTKGPPAIAVIAVAGYGPIVLDAVFNGRPAQPTRAAARLSLLGLIVLAAAAAAATLPKVGGVEEAIGAGLIIATCGGIGWVLGRAFEPAAMRSIFRTFSWTHPVAVLGTPLLALWGWGRLVSRRIGPENAEFWARKETEDNLNVLVPISPIKNLEAMSFGVGLGSLLTIAALLWLISRRPRMTPSWLVPAAWVVFGFAVFSLLGKGIGRYLTPVWPGLAMLGGIWIAQMLAKDRNAQLVRTVLAGTVVVAACASGWWYGFGREAYFPSRSPRAIVHELRDSGVRTDRMASFEFRTAAIDFYARSRAEPVGDIQIRDVTAGGKPWTLEELRSDIASNGERIVFMRERQLGSDGRDPRPAAERLAEAGMAVDPIATTSRFTIDSGKSNVIAARVTVRREQGVGSDPEGPAGVRR